MESYQRKAAFLNTVYERFFQGYSVKKQADTHGIVYTPQPIVDFMVRSVEEVLRAEFGKSLSDTGVHIFDPFVGTGNFITRVMQQIKTSRLPQKYRNELHCNEVMLLPYYIASMNIEHAYLERTQEYEPFEGICLVDTFELAEAAQGALFTTENTERVKRQKAAPIFVILGNPPYNSGQKEENDDNKNRKYPVIDGRVSNTYGRASIATLTRKLQDPYIKAFRWASDRIGSEGLIAFVSNSSFVHERSLDGVRKHLSDEFDVLYIVDLGGNIHKNPDLSGTTHNVFGIQLGVSISILVKHERREDAAKIFYTSVPRTWKAFEKFEYLDRLKELDLATWETVHPDGGHAWIKPGILRDTEKFIPMAINNSKTGLYASYSLGVSTNRDGTVIGFGRDPLAKGVADLSNTYNLEATKAKVTISKLSDSIKWSSTLKDKLKRDVRINFSDQRIRSYVYRPFTKLFIYFDSVLIDRPGHTANLFPCGGENIGICVTGPGSDKPFVSLVANDMLDLHLVGAGCTTQCFPFYTYNEDGSRREENITDWALDEFRRHYGDPSIKKCEIFRATYAVLHHPEYRTRYAANLKRELPRIPFVPQFNEYARIGGALMKLHIEYERQPEYPLERREKGTLNWRVEKMTLSKDKTQLKYNDFLTLCGIPPEVYEYRLGNRSALEWVVDQYRVTTDSRSGIVNDPNREDDPEYIVRLIGQMVTVSIGTVQLVEELAELPLLPK